ncbi:protein PML-like isoform X1 [Haliotis cracherodii]|uniref:protein PML-like isoform X1 n=2 Tax=Haliotis cracherodii TaxID=6455 RepID=UPI0039EC20E4
MGGRHSRTTRQHPGSLIRSLSVQTPPDIPVKGVTRSNSQSSSRPVMAEYLKVGDMQEAVMECPVCSYVFDSDDRTPRLMSCCVSSICSSCINDILSRGGSNCIDCPLCRTSHTITEGVASFPLERVMLKMVEYVKVQKGHKFPCTGCPDDNQAVARCKDCGLFMCEDCLNAHKRNGVTRDHTTVSFHELRNQSILSFGTSHHCGQHKLNPLQFYCRKCDRAICVSCTVVEHKEVNGHTIVSLDDICDERASQADAVLTSLDVRIRLLGADIETMNKKKKILNTSKTSAKRQVESTFDALIESLKQRKVMLLTEVDTRYEVHSSAIDQRLDETKSLTSRVASASEYIRHVRSKADEIESLQLFSRVKQVLDGIVHEKPEADDWERKGLGFDPTFARDVDELIQHTGAIKTVTFMKDQTTSGAQTLYIQPSVPEEAKNLQSHVTVCGHVTDERQPFHMTSLLGDRVIVLDDITVDNRPAAIHCPRLRFDAICLSRDCSTTPEGVLVNWKLQKHPPGSETGCRLKVGRRALVSPTLGGDGLQLWQTTVRAKIKTASADNSMIFEAAVTPRLVDAGFAQPSGFSLNLSDCHVHSQLCLKLRKDGELKADVPIGLNQPEVEHILDLGFLLDGVKKHLHVFDLSARKTLVTIDNMDTLTPLWLVYYVDTPEESDIQVTLVSGVNIQVTDWLVDLLKGVC